MIFIETPSNPMNSPVEIALVRPNTKEIGRRQGSRLFVCYDNTLLWSIFQSTLRHDADLSLYSLTKYVGGHSDLIGGASVGYTSDLMPIQAMQGAIGTQLDPHSCWMMVRFLETLAVWVDRATCNAAIVAKSLAGHGKVARVHYPPLRPADHPTRRSMERESASAGCTFSSDIRAGARGDLRFPQSSSAVQTGAESQRNGSMDLSSDDDSALRIDAGGPPRDRNHVSVDTHVDRDRACGRSPCGHRAGARMKSGRDAGRPTALRCRGSRRSRETSRGGGG